MERFSFFSSFFIVLLIVVVSAFFIYNGRVIQINNDTWLSKEEVSKRNIDYLNSEFKGGEEFALAITLQEDYYQDKIVNRFYSLIREIEEIKFIKEVQSPITATISINKDDTLQIKSFYQSIQTKAISDLQEYKEQLEQSIYFGRLISRDHKVLAIVVTMEKENNLKITARRAQVIQHVKEIMSQYKDFHNYRIVGEVYLNTTLDSVSRSNLVLFLFLSIGVIIVVLLLLLRRVLLTFFLCFTSLVCLFSVLAIHNFFSTPLSAVGIALPVLILVICIADSIHIIVRWDKLYLIEKKKAITTTIKQLWLPCFLTSLTTAIGFGTFYFSQLIPLKDLGEISFFTIFLAYGIIILFSYGFLSIFYKKLVLKSSPEKESFLTVFLSKAPLFIETYYKHIVVGSITIFVFFVGSSFLFYTETNFLDVFFKKKSHIYQNFQYFDEHLGGTGSLDIVFPEVEEEFFKGFIPFKEIVSLTEELKYLPFVNYSLSYDDSLSMIHKNFATDNSVSPNNQDELYQEIAFLEFSRSAEKRDILAPYVNFDFSSARIQLATSNITSLQTEILQQEIKKNIEKKNLPSYFLTGTNIYFQSLGDYVVKTQLVTIILTLISVWVFLLICFGWRVGTIGIIPNIIPLMVTFILIALTKTPLDFAIVLIASVSIGICVDDSIHYLHYYKNQKRTTSDHQDIIKKTTHALGKPIFYTSLLFSCGFGVFLFSELVVLIKFGFFTIITLISAFFSNIFVLPAFLKMFDRKVFIRN